MAEKTFRITRNFDTSMREAKRLEKYKIASDPYRIIETDHGNVLAFRHSVAVDGDLNSLYVSTMIPGFYIREGDVERGLRTMIVEPVEKGKRADVAEALKKAGYKDPFDFW